MDVRPATIDRFGGVLLGALGVGGTVFLLLIVPGILLARSRRAAGLVAEVVMAALETAQFWIAALLLTSMVAGYLVGSDRIIRWLGHLWFTEKPRQPAFSVLLWSSLTCIACVVHWVVTYYAL